MEALYTFSQVVYKHVLHLPALTLPQGGITTLFGPSGSGKSTLLRLLNKLASPTTGQLLYKGWPLNEVDSTALRREVSLLSQAPVLFEGTVQDNLCAGLRMQGRAEPAAAALEEVLQQVQLPVKLHDATHHLSGGERQRLSLGRLLLLNSPVYLLDEPSSALDSHTAEAVVATMAGWIRQNNKTLIMVTHSPALAKAYSSRIVHLAGGMVTRQEELA